MWAACTPLLWLGHYWCRLSGFQGCPLTQLSAELQHNFFRYAGKQGCPPSCLRGPATTAVGWASVEGWSQHSWLQSPAVTAASAGGEGRPAVWLTVRSSCCRCSSIHRAGAAWWGGSGAGQGGVAGAGSHVRRLLACGSVGLSKLVLAK